MRTVAVLAGDLRQFTSWLRDQPQYLQLGTGAKPEVGYAVYADDQMAMRAGPFDDVFVTGTFWSRRDAQMLYDHAHSRRRKAA